MNFQEYIKPELVTLIPVLYLVGMAFKKSSVKDKFIPFILGLISVILCGLYVLGTSDMPTWKDAIMAIFTALTQGILISGASVYANQLFKQGGKDE